MFLAVPVDGGGKDQKNTGGMKKGREGEGGAADGLGLRQKKKCGSCGFDIFFGGTVIRRDSMDGNCCKISVPKLESIGAHTEKGMQKTETEKKWRQIQAHEITKR